MSQTRKLRRTRQKGLDSAGNFKNAMQTLSTQMQALQDVEKIPNVLENLEGAVKKVDALAEALTKDYNTLLRRIEVLEEKTGFHYTEEPEPQEGA